MPTEADLRRACTELAADSPDIEALLTDLPRHEAEATGQTDRTWWRCVAPLAAVARGFGCRSDYPPDREEVGPPIRSPAADGASGPDQRLSLRHRARTGVLGHHDRPGAGFQYHPAGGRELLGPALPLYLHIFRRDGRMGRPICTWRVRRINSARPSASRWQWHHGLPGGRRHDVSAELPIFVDRSASRALRIGTDPQPPRRRLSYGLGPGVVVCSSFLGGPDCGHEF